LGEGRWGKEMEYGGLGRGMRRSKARKRDGRKEGEGREMGLEEG